MKIQRLKVVSYRGIEALEEAIPPAGAVVQGRNGAGKTSVLKAIRAALAAQDIGPDAVRLGADKAEILVDLDDISVRRVITPKTSSVTVTNRDGMKAQKPQTFLTELLGTSPLDPIDLVLEKDKKKRKAKILEALPVTVTLEQLRQWAPDLGHVDTSGHGLEVLERIRKMYYDMRTAANKAVDAAVEDARRMSLDPRLEHLNKPAVSVDFAQEARRTAHEEWYRLESRNAQARLSEQRSASTRASIEETLQKASEYRKRAAKIGPPDDELYRAQGDVELISGHVANLEEKLARMKESLVAAKAVLDGVSDRRQEAESFIARANQLEMNAAQLTGALQQASVPPVSPEELSAARDAVDEADRNLESAMRYHEAKSAARILAEKETACDTAKSNAERLDAVVKTLTNDATAYLLENADAIPGLGIDGDDVTLDGKRLDSLCGAEQLRFAVDVAKRLNAKSRLLICDGLERLDPEAREDFVRFATANGWQLLATCVDRGDPVFAAISTSDE